MKTAMQRHLEWLKTRIVVTEQMEQELLKLEKQQIIEFLEEYDSFIFRGGDMSEEEYYDYTFKQD